MTINQKLHQEVSRSEKRKSQTKNPSDKSGVSSLRSSLFRDFFGHDGLSTHLGLFF